MYWNNTDRRWRSLGFSMGQMVVASDNGRKSRTLAPLDILDISKVISGELDVNLLKHLTMKIKRYFKFVL